MMKRFFTFFQNDNYIAKIIICIQSTENFVIYYVKCTFTKKSMKIKYIPLSLFIAVSLFSGNKASATTVTVLNNPIAEINTSPFNYSRTEVRYIIKLMISDIIDIDPAIILNDDLLMHTLGLDSVDVLDLILQCMDFFEINFNVADALSYSHQYTVDSFTDFIYHFCISDEDYQ